MADSKFSMENMVEIWDDKHGECLEVGPDRDGLDLLEIRQMDSNGKVHNRITLVKEQALLLVEAISEVISRNKLR
jgi:hypothetical protein